MAGILYVVATPIGNLEDVTLRALRILREVSVIAAEDTRRTARLLQHYSISTRTTSLHAHNEREKTPQLIGRLQAGESIALVSDAGTPLISDPGQTLVAAARESGIRIESIPGPSAVMAALSSSGLKTGEFVFLEFPPTRSKDRTSWFAALASQTRLAVFFEAPHRIRRTLSDMAIVLGGDREIGIGRELTKSHEESVVQPITRHLSYFVEPKGEFTLLVPPRGTALAGHRPPPELVELRRQFGELTNNNALSRRQALKLLAERHGLAVNELYKSFQDDDRNGQ
ncbi:MAG: 16S rRNA (cytidine(1402)-2'-O)-methyltransferase [Vicinamibacterales bacterium]